jgi:hypothetical protein
LLGDDAHSCLQQAPLGFAAALGLRAPFALPCFGVE